MEEPFKQEYTWWTRSRIEKLYLTPLIIAFLVQSVATICQIVQIYCHIFSLRHDWPNLLSASATLFVFPYSLLKLFALVLVLQRRWIARLWSTVGIFATSSSTMRSAAFAIKWYFLLGLCHIPQWMFLMAKQENMVPWILEGGCFVLGNVALSLVFLKVASWKRTYLACLLYCLLSTALFVADMQKGFLPYRSSPPLKLKEKTAEVFYLAAKYNFDPQLIRRSPGSEYLSPKHLSDGKRIYISQYIYNRQEKAAAMAYELGRLAHHDAEIEAALLYIKQLISDIFMFYCITPEVYAAFGVGDEALITAVAIRDAFSGSFSALLQPFYNIFQQSRVYAADAFVVSTGYGKYMVTLMMDSPINLTANKLFEMVFLSEPSKEKREAAIYQKMETQ